MSRSVGRGVLLRGLDGPQTVTARRIQATSRHRPD
jgi:hypothetical protein